ncbi:unnamed protein product [Lasius platythorax]|uniref:Uncharacterized protein n=1 Tax=Lasius platythorax TaxID=488582 RepID=A0AAV2NYR6_9HYME
MVEKYKVSWFLRQVFNLQKANLGLNQLRKFRCPLTP